jgi:hypothetical protein
MRRAAWVLPFAVLASVAPAVAAPTPEEVAAAEQLFGSGLKLMEDGRFSEACPKLEKSQKLDPGTGTLLNLALCNEAIGKTASAWSQFRLVVGEAREKGRLDRMKTAQEHADALAPKLSYLTVELSPGARVNGLEVLVDGAPRAADLLGIPLPSDPGTRRVEARAPGKRAWSGDVDVGPDSDRKAIVIPALEDAPAAPVTAPPPADRAAPAAEGGGSRTAGWIIGGAGLATLLAGGVFGLLAIARNDDSIACGAQPVCNDTSYSTARGYAWAANIAVPLGAIGVGVGAYLLLAPAPAPTRSVRLAPLGGARALGLGLEGRF